MAYIVYVYIPIDNTVKHGVHTCLTRAHTRYQVNLSSHFIVDLVYIL